MTSGDLQGMRACPSQLTSVSTAVISRPSHKRHRQRCATAPSMPEGPVPGVPNAAAALGCQCGVDANGARSRAERSSRGEH